MNYKEVAEEIFNQLGGNRFAVMTGAKQFIALTKPGLRMKLPKNNSGANYLDITLQSNDLYEMRFYCLKLNSKTFETMFAEKAGFTDVYVESLQDVFTQITGLYTHL